MDLPEIPLELEAIRQLAETQPDLVRQVYYWALAMVMAERDKVHVVEEQAADGQTQYTFASPEGEVVRMVKPAANEAILAEMMTAVRTLVEEEFRRMAQESSSDTSQG